MQKTYETQCRNEKTNSQGKSLKSFKNKINDVSMYEMYRCIV